MNLTDAIKEIEELIEKLGELLSEDDYMEALHEMSERATNAYNALQEEKDK